MRSQNAGLGLKGSSYGASSSDTYQQKLKKLVCFFPLTSSVTRVLRLSFFFVGLFVSFLV